MYKIKQIPEDFYVKELINLKFNSGNYSYFLLKKRNLTTLEAINTISKRFKINIKNIGYAGNKDKRAITEQYISILNCNLKDIKFNDLGLKFLGYGNERIKLGNNLGNEFLITVRNLDKKYNGIKFIVNYFDEQRFSKINIKIGKYLLQEKFKEICNLLKLDDENPIMSLNKFNKKELRFYLHSYQSFIFNKSVAEYLKNKYKYHKKVKYSSGSFIFVDKKENLKFPLISFDAKFNKKDKIYLKILKEEKINLEQFIIKKIPWLIEETSYRNVFANVKNFKIVKYEKDELNKGEFKQIISFTLPKGSYATILVKEIFE